MALTFDMQGTTFTRSGITLAPKSMTVPGWAKESIDVTTLNNSGVRTFAMKKLKTINDFVLTLVFDAAVYAAIPTGNGQWTVAFPDGAGSLTFWGDVMSVGDVSADEGSTDQPTFDLTIKVTNLNSSGAETAPV
jgi:hypothetical protein